MPDPRDEVAPSAVAAAASGVSARLVALASALRERDVHVGTGQLLTAHRALSVVDPVSPAQASTALQSVLCTGHADIPAFRAAFAEVFGAGGFEEFATDPPRPWNAPPKRGPGAADGDGGGGQGSKPGFGRRAVSTGASSAALETGAQAGREDASGAEAPVATWSQAELLRHKDFAAYTGDDEREAMARLRQIAAALPRRRSHRLVGAGRRGRSLATRPMLRSAVRHAGEVLDVRWRHPDWRARQVVLVCDVSGSMEPYARMLLRYLHACVAYGRGVEAFVFGTRLTRATLALRMTDQRRALHRLSSSVVDAAGGTRIGAAIGELNRSWGARLSRGAVVVILSDGWDRGDPAVLEAELGRLRRCAHRVVWLNPLSARPGYEPLARGMRQALAYVDELHAGNTLASLELVTARLGDRRPRERERQHARSLARAR